MTKLIDRIGSLELHDTGRRCSTVGHKIFLIRCTAGCSMGEELIEALIFVWDALRLTSGWHHGCNNLAFNTPEYQKVREENKRRYEERHDPLACPACNKRSCSGAPLTH